MGDVIGFQRIQITDATEALQEALAEGFDSVVIVGWTEEGIVSLVSNQADKLTLVGACEYAKAQVIEA